ncbi:MAG: hypothetical protein ACO1RT_08485 [Planctomycetaceae bacterium]
MFTSNHPQRRSGIVLLIALGMLSLFSVLIVTYVVFTSHARQSAFTAAQRRSENVEVKPVLDAAIRSIVSGDTNPSSPAYLNDLLGDLYGVDHVNLRVAHRRITGGSGGDVDARGRLLRPVQVINNEIKPQSTLFKFPIHLAPWHADGSDSDGRRAVTEVVAPMTTADFGNAAWRNLLAARGLPDYRLNDVFAGRLITFTEGPLAGSSFRVVRSFGTAPTAAGTAADVALQGCLVIDLSEFGSTEVEIDGERFNLYRVANDNPNVLLYSMGRDGSYGAGPAPFVAGDPASDDLGYRILMNGVPFNGRGQNASGVAGVSRINRNNPSNPAFDIALDSQFGIELMPNRRVTGPTRQGFLSEPDETYDAADFDNWFLAWQPSDHRAILPAAAAALGLPTDAAPNIIPSFHRPEVVNYLMHAPIWYDDNGNGSPDTGESRYFHQLDPGTTNDALRLQLLTRRIRAAVYRPLNFAHPFFSGSNAADVDGDAYPFDGDPQFSGSNPTAILRSPIDTITFAQAKDNLASLARWLINGPWDVDNDGDDVPDSLWMDFKIPTQTLANGTVVRPLIAPLIEDLDGRINLNAAGTWAQLTSGRFSGTNPTGYMSSGGARPDEGYVNTNTALQFFGRGGGVGPAEINFTHLFDEYRTGATTQPLFFTQTSPARLDVLRTRTGNLFQSRYGGTPYDFRSNIMEFFVAMPGENVGRSPQPQFSDPLSRMIFPARRRLHEIDTATNDVPMARPMDMHGRSTVRKDRYGNYAVDLVGAAVPTPVPTVAGTVVDEVINQPYEFTIDSPTADDRPFSAAEFHSLIERGTADAISRRLSDLIGDAADQNEALERLITFDSRSLDVVELPGGQSIVQFMIDRLPATIAQSNPQLVNEQIERMLAVELRKGSKLNLNRSLANGNNDGSDAAGGYLATLTDETYETEQAGVAVVANENAFPQLANATNTTFNNQAAVRADYLPVDAAATAGPELPQLSAAELLARNLYCLMFRLIVSPGVDTTNPTVELVPTFPYPTTMITTDIPFRNRYVAKRLAQWAANVVDMRDTDAKMTRLRYDPNPFDNNGFDLTAAAANVVWGMERPELELTETIAFHDVRTKRNLDTPLDPMNPTLTLDGEYAGDEDDTDPAMAPESDDELDQFRIPEATAIVELHSLRSPHVNPTPAQLENYPSELYDFSAGRPRLDLGRVVGTGAGQSPVWRLAVGYTTATDQHKRSALWVNDAERMATIDPTLPSPLVGVPPADHAAGSTNSQWVQKIQHIAEVTHQVGDNSQVWLYDDDLDPTTVPSHSITLSRFVWFGNLAPDDGDPATPAGLNVVTGASGMRVDNVFYPRNVLGTANSPYLEGDQDAGGMPREEAGLGSTRESMAGNNWAYRPSNQHFGLVENAAQTERALRYVDLGNSRGAPNTRFEGGAYRLKPIVPIIARSLAPHQIDATATDWSTYFTTAAFNNMRVDVGFNISAPLSGPDYYRAPTHRINDGSPAATDAYPLVDGYRDYVAAAGQHPDVPFDEEPTAPLRVNNWLGLGTHQDVASVFLQRLADPTKPWDATHNPYITVDLMTMDLTVFNGEEDLDQLIDRDGDMIANEPVDLNTFPYPTELAFDTRRKIPDSSRERPLTKLVQDIPTPPSDPDYPYDISHYNRYVYAQRSPLMSVQSVLRNVAPDTSIATPTRPYFNFELTSAWEGSVTTNAFAPATNATSTLDTNFQYDATKHRFDGPALTFPQTLGFVNREYGEPAAAYTTFAEGTDPGAATPDEGRLLGFPIGVSYLMPSWLDRPFQSPYEIISVPATSQTRLHNDYSPGTQYDPAAGEKPIAFPYLLGFESNLGNYQATDAADLTTGAAATVNSQTAAGFQSLTGSRAGFEQIFDLVDTGPVSFEQRRWLDPVQVQPITVSNITDAMFDRVTQTLRPPFNYIDRQRTPGKVNLNTTPDYIRQAGGYSGHFSPATPDFQRPLDAGEAPHTPQTLAAPSPVATPAHMGVISSPTNRFAGQPSDPANAGGNVLYGNGSVYRALSAGHSTFYELDDEPGSPITMGAFNQYERSVDTRFGLGFKSFVESRRGYPTTYANRLGVFDPSNPYTNFLNIDLDFRYPSRFVGMFSPASTSTLPSVQRYLRLDTAAATESMLRRTHDMSLLRPHPDFDERLVGAARRTAMGNMSEFMLAVEQTPASGVAIPVLQGVRNASNNGGTVAPEVAGLEMSMGKIGFIERSQPELHKNSTQLARDPFYRFQNVTRMSNLTTHHSNVFMIRMTVGYFVVDPATGALGEEFLDPRNGYLRPRAFYLVDRSIPVAYEPGQQHNASNTIIFASEE